MQLRKLIFLRTVCCFRFSTHFPIKTDKSTDPFYQQATGSLFFRKVSNRMESDTLVDNHTSLQNKLE